MSQASLPVLRRCLSSRVSLLQYTAQKKAEAAAEATAQGKASSRPNSADAHEQTNNSTDTRNKVYAQLSSIRTRLLNMSGLALLLSIIAFAVFVTEEIFYMSSTIKWLWLSFVLWYTLGVIGLAVSITLVTVHRALKEVS